MNAKEIVSKVMEKRGFTNSALAKKLGFSTPSGVSERLRGKQDMRVDTLAKFLDAMDCDVIIRSRIGNKESWKVEIGSEE